MFVTLEFTRLDRWVTNDTYTLQQNSEHGAKTHKLLDAESRSYVRLEG